MQLTIAGVDRTRWLAASDGRIRMEASGQRVLEMRLEDIYRGYRPELGDAVALTDGSTVLFRGNVWRVRAETNEAHAVTFRVECADYNHIAARRLVVLDKQNVSLPILLAAIINAGLSGEGVTVHPDVPSTEVQTRIVAFYETVASVLKRICDIGGWTWRIDEQKRLYVGPWIATSPPTSLDELECMRFEVERSRERYRNRQLIRVEAIPQGQYGDEYIYLEPDPNYGWGFPSPRPEGAYLNIGTRATINSITSLTVNNVPKTWIAITPGDTIPDSGYDFFFFPGGFGIFCLDYWPSEGDVVHIVYDPGIVAEWMTAGAKYKVIAVERTNEIYRLRAREGGSGIWEAIEEMPQGSLVAAMQALAEARLRQYATDQAIVRARTMRELWPGQQVHVTSALHDLDLDMVVDTVDMSWESVPGGVAKFWDATLTEGDPLGRPWSYFQRLLDQARAGGGGAYRAMAAPSGEWAFWTGPYVLVDDETVGGSVPFTRELLSGTTYGVNMMLDDPPVARELFVTGAVQKVTG